MAEQDTHQRLRRLIEQRLAGTRPSPGPGDALPAGLMDGDPDALRAFYPPSPAAAAVLMPIVDHEHGLTVLLTQRAQHLRHHAGQVSFPGGRIEPTDGSVLQAALRETQEEIGLGPEHITVAGYLQPQLVLSGFWVTPVVGFVRPGFDLKLDRSEVDAAFEVPLPYLLDARNHRARQRRMGEVTVQVHDIPYGPHHIWGATAGMLLALYRLLNT